MDYLSCDNVNDAIRSLALAYQTHPEIIRSTYSDNWPSEFRKNTPCEDFKHPWLPWGMGKHIESAGIIEDVCVCFYHRSRFDGSPDWFSDGLLNNSDGEISFFKKLAQHTNETSALMIAQSLASVVIHQRDAICGIKGPHAFFRLRRQSTQHTLEWTFLSLNFSLITYGKSTPRKDR